MAKIFITGCGGFVGRVLVQRLVADGHEVSGIDRVGWDDFPGSTLLTGDLNDHNVVDDALNQIKPSAIVHLAAQASVRQSFDTPAETLAANTAPTLHILNYLRRTDTSVRLLAVGSADEYGTILPEFLPLREDTPIAPVSPYALAKSIQNQCCMLFAELYGTNVVITRSFNHTGAGQRDVFVLPSFARQVVEIKKGLKEPVLLVGNLEVKRDFLDVRDVCSAYIALLNKGRRGETYNVCSGESQSVRSILERMCEIADVEIEINIDPERLRPVDVPELRGDANKLRAETGWTPEFDMDDTLRSLLDYWDEIVKSG